MPRYRRVYWNRRPDGGYDRLSLGPIALFVLWIGKVWFYLLMLYGFPYMAVTDPTLNIAWRLVLGFGAPILGFTAAWQRHLVKINQRKGARHG